MEAVEEPSVAAVVQPSGERMTLLDALPEGLVSMPTKLPSIMLPGGVNATGE